jgi:hypothetical protein
MIPAPRAFKAGEFAFYTQQDSILSSRQQGEILLLLGNYRTATI